MLMKFCELTAGAVGALYGCFGAMAQIKNMLSVMDES